MSHAPKTVETYKLTVRDFHALFPLLDSDQRHELLDGQIYIMPIPGTPHVRALRRLERQFLRHEGPGLCIWAGGLILSEHAEVWPDLMLREAEPPEGAPAALPAQVKLLVEVSDTTLHHDAHKKLWDYHRAGVAEYWVLDVQGRQVLRYLPPSYASEAFVSGGPPLSPQAYPDVAIDVGALFS
ncbi:MAG: Uma2 family endonuclease [Verrucomicrobia bacterium]|nr:Uma2 family endonuclease [Verrucomicrobiota bacterium]